MAALMTQWKHELREEALQQHKEQMRVAASAAAAERAKLAVALKAKRMRDLKEELRQAELELRVVSVAGDAQKVVCTLDMQAAVQRDMRVPAPAGPACML
jgi:hypothetical protein